MADFSALTKLDRLVHNPGRLAILAVLAGCESADFTYLQHITQLNKGTLSKHLSALESADYIEITKRFRDRVPNTNVRMTPAGRKALRDYQRQHSKLMKMIGTPPARG